jgi:hypothetical protein
MVRHAIAGTADAYTYQLASAVQPTMAMFSWLRRTWNAGLRKYIEKIQTKTKKSKKLKLGKEWGALLWGSPID